MIKLFYGICLMAAIALITPAMGRAIVDTGDPDIYGFFDFKDKAPKQFANIDFFELAGTGEFGAQAKPRPYYGNIRLSDRWKTDYAIQKPAWTGNKIHLFTKKVSGVQYEFEGTFTRLDIVTNQPGPDDVVLTGTFRKLRAGKVIA